MSGARTPARQQVARIVRECQDGLVARGFVVTGKHQAVRPDGFPCTVEAERWTHSGGRGGARYDWRVWFAKPGSALVDGRLPLWLVGYSQADQVDADLYALQDPVQAEAFRRDFDERTLPFLEEASSPGALLEMILGRRVLLSRAGDAEFPRARAALDLLVHCDLVGAERELALAVVADVVRRDPSERRSVERWARDLGVDDPSVWTVPDRP